MTKQYQELFEQFSTATHEDQEYSIPVEVGGMGEPDEDDDDFFKIETVDEKDS